MNNDYPEWMNNLQEKLKKKAIEKLPDDELDSGLPDASMMPQSEVPQALPIPPETPLVWNNRYHVKTDGPEFIVELTPSIVADPTAQADGLPQAQTSEMSDQSLNPNADPELLKEWMKSSDDSDKPLESEEQGTVDPLSKQEDGIEDTGDEQSVKVHTKKALLKQSGYNDGDISGGVAPMPGADRSNAYPPCKYCANFNAADNTCSQGLDVEKVQAAKSCSWLNSTLSPFKNLKDQNVHRQDKDIVQNDVSQLPGGGEGAEGGKGLTARLNINKSEKSIQDYLKHIWD